MDQNGCSEAGLVEHDDDEYIEQKQPHINIWYHHPDLEEKAIKLFKLCDKAPEMYEALKEIKKISKRLNLWVGIDTIINPLLNDIDNGNK